MADQSSSRPMLLRRVILPLAVVFLALAGAGVLGPAFGKLSQVQKNDNSAFLPQAAESTKVLDVLTGFQDEQTIPTTIIAERRGGLTDADKDQLEQYAGDFADVDGAVIDENQPIKPVYAKDGEAAELVVNLKADDSEKLIESVKDLRKVVADPPAGLTVKVGGGGGVLGDFIKAFGAIDGILLLVALGVVFLILLLVYRALLLPFLVLISAMIGLAAAGGIAYYLARDDVLDISGQSQGILFILAIGAATDYSLLLVARFREELRDHPQPWTAMKRAYGATFEPILASGATVIFGLLCLLLADMSSLAGLGPVGALGIAGAVLSSLTLLPALLLLFGRAAFWPVMPKYGSEHRDTRGLWGRLARLIDRKARPVWIGTFLVLAACAAFVPTLNEEQVPQTDLFLTEVEAVQAQKIIDEHFTADAANPAQIAVPEYQVFPTLELLDGHPGIAKATSKKQPSVFYIPDPDADPLFPGGPPAPKVVDGKALVFATLDAPADSAKAERIVRQLRNDLDAIEPAALVGGNAAIQLDVRDTTQADRRVVIPAILVVIFVVLALLLRSIVAPVLLLIANVLSFGATLGISAVLFNHVFDFPGVDPSTPLIGFVFLVALGIDYSIFLMTRVREEAIKQGTHPGILKGLSVTGGVITSAGVVLAATFAALGVIPILFLAQIAFIVAFGVLLDAIVVRSLLVPALAHDVGSLIWWPSKLWREKDHADAETEQMLHPDAS